MEPSVITLIAATDFPLPLQLVEQISADLAASGAANCQISPLSKNTAYDISFSASPLENALAIATRHIGSHPIDKIAQGVKNRRKKLLISDMDSTIINQECIDELADYAGCKAHIATITERAMNGELDFKAALRERVALLKGLPESVLEQAFQERITLMSGAKALLATMRAAGAATVLVSGGFTFFTSRVAAEVGFSLNEANRLEIHNGKLTGKVIEPILDKQAKLESLKHHTLANKLLIEQTLAVGDGANDLPMLLASGLGVAYHAKPKVRSEAKAQINFSDLKALLYMQGYREEEILN